MHPLFERHDPGSGHPERPERYAAVARAVAASGAEVVEASAAPRDALERVHDADYLAAIERLAASGGGHLDPDTAVNEVSFQAAELASGAALAAVEDVLGGSLDRVFCGGRPPGHHAERVRAMGFCLVNHAAVAAARAAAEADVRVAVLDWDAHHGNGTQAIFYDDPSVLYVSLHQWPFYPGTGAAGERGAGAGEGATVNIPLPAGTSEQAYLEAFDQVAVPALEAFAPDLLVVSAGFDAHRDDPLCSLGLTAGAFARMAQSVAHIGAGQVFVLEGGYDLDALEESTLAVLTAF
jgi:acetoin utilization deacetylase AcuC-like enzyme